MSHKFINSNKYSAYRSKVIIFFSKFIWFASASLLHCSKICSFFYVYFEVHSFRHFFTFNMLNFSTTHFDLQFVIYTVIFKQWNWGTKLHIVRACLTLMRYLMSTYGYWYERTEWICYTVVWNALFGNNVIELTHITFLLSTWEH